MAATDINFVQSVDSNDVEYMLKSSSANSCILEVIDSRSDERHVTYRCPIAVSLAEFEQVQLTFGGRNENEFYRQVIGQHRVFAHGPLTLRTEIQPPEPGYTISCRMIIKSFGAYFSHPLTRKNASPAVGGPFYWTIFVHGDNTPPQMKHRMYVCLKGPGSDHHTPLSDPLEVNCEYEVRLEFTGNHCSLFLQGEHVGDEPTQLCNDFEISRHATVEAGELIQKKCVIESIHHSDFDGDVWDIREQEFSITSNIVNDQ